MIGDTGDCPALWIAGMADTVSSYRGAAIGSIVCPAKPFPAGSDSQKNVPELGDFQHAP